MVSYKKYLDIEVFEGEISKHEYPWHFHNCYTVILVESGSIKYEFNNTSLSVDKEEVLIIEPNAIHRNTISQPTIYKALFLPKEYFVFSEQEKILTQKVGLPNIANVIVNLLNKIKLIESKNELTDAFFGLQKLINQHNVNQRVGSHSNCDTIPKIDYDLTIDELAEKAHLSKFHFQRKFKKNNGLTIGQLKQQEKTIEAKTLLEKGRLANDVAYELGFFDQSHFIKYFKKMWAVTPKKIN